MGGKGWKLLSMELKNALSKGAVSKHVPSLSSRLAREDDKGKEKERPSYAKAMLGGTGSRKEVFG